MQKSFHKFLAASVSTVVAASVLAPVAPFNVLSAEAAKDFTDVSKGSYYYDAVMVLSQRGVINGFADGTFRPNEQVTRAQAATMIAASLGLTGKTAANPAFKDVQEGAWYHSAVATLVELGIMSGVDKEHFLPNKAITRAELSKMLGHAYSLKQSTTKTNFTDVSEKSWYAGFVGAMIDNKITTGMTKTTFAPTGKVTRGQMAAFIYRAENAFFKAVSIEKITQDSITISGATYKLAQSVKTILNPANEAALKNADLKFQTTNGTITKLTYLELKTSGTANTNLTLDAKGATIYGHVKISADYVSVKNLTTKGNFTLAKEVQNSFTSDKLTVEGKTLITNEAAQTTFKAASSDKIYKSLSQTISQPTFKKAAETTNKTNVIFNNATLNAVEVNKPDVKLESKGTTKLHELNVAANATITATDGVTIPKLTVQQGAAQVEVNGNVQELSVQTSNAFTLSGQTNIEKLKIDQKANISIQSTGEIKEINSTNKDTQITVNQNVKVGNIVLPEGTNPSDIITNYNEVKGNIEQVGGKTNPDAQPPAPAPTPTPTPLPPVVSDTTAPTITNLTHETPTQTSVNVNFTSSESGKVYYVVLPATAQVPTSQQIKAGQDHTGAPVALKGNQNITTANVETMITLTGLTANTQYKIYIVAEDAAANLSAASSIQVQTAAQDVDQTPPVIDMPHFGVHPASATSLDFSVKVNEAANAYYVLLPENAEIPSIQQIKEGKNHDNQPALKASTFTLNANEQYTHTINGLTASTTYKLVTVIEDASGNQTEVHVFTPTTLADETAPTYTLTFGVVGGHGTMVATENGVAIQSGATILIGENTVQYVATPDPGYRVKNWYVNGVATGNKLNTFSTANPNPATTEYNVTVEFEPADPPPSVTKVSSIDFDFTSSFSNQDSVSLYFSEEPAVASKAAIEAEVEGMTSLFGEGVTASWISFNGTHRLAIQLMSDTFTLNQDSVITLSKENVYDAEGNYPENDVNIEIPDYFTLHGGLKLPTGSATTTSVILRFSGEVHDDTKAITDVASIIRDSTITRVINGANVVLPVTALQWNQDYSELTLTIPETTFTNGEQLRASLLNVKDANDESRILGGAISTITLDEPTPPPASDVTPPHLAYVSNDSLIIGRNLGAMASEDGTLYLVPKGTVATVAALNEAVETAGVKVSTTEGQSTLLNTTGLAAGTYTLYAVDASNNVSAASRDITLIEDSVSLEGKLSFTVSFGDRELYPEPLDYANVQIVPITGLGSSHSIQVNTMASPLEDGVRFDLSALDSSLATEFYALIYTNGHLLIEKFTPADIGVGLLKEVVVGDEYAAIQTSVAGLNDTHYSDSINLHLVNESGRAFLDARVSSGTKIPYGTYNIQFLATRANASYSLFKENFTLSAANSTLSFTEEELAAITFNMDSQNEVSYILDDVAPLYFLGEKYNTITSPRLQEGNTTLWLTKGYYEKINPNYIISKNDEYWDITFFEESVDVQNDQSLTFKDDLAINVNWAAHIQDKKMMFKQAFRNFFSTTVQNSLGQKVEWFYKTTKTQWGFYNRLGSVNGKVTIFANGREYSKVINAFRFGDVTISEITGGEVLSGQVEILFEVIDSPIVIAPYRETVVIEG